MGEVQILTLSVFCCYLQLGTGEKQHQKNNKGEAIIVGAVSLQNKESVLSEAEESGDSKKTVFINLLKPELLS